MARRTAKELWDALDKATLDAELESELAMTPEERRQDLVKAGVDVDALDAEADAFFASLPAKAVATAAPAASPTAAPDAPSAPVVAAPSASAPVTVLRPKRRRLAVVLPVGLALAAAVALAIKVSLPEPVPIAIPPDDTPAGRAAALRADARKSCNAHRWPRCVDELDDAKELDPAGDDTPEIREMRRAAAEGMAHP